jgi:hypothetical protein
VYEFGVVSENYRFVVFVTLFFDNGIDVVPENKTMWQEARSNRQSEDFRKKKNVSWRPRTHGTPRSVVAVEALVGRSKTTTTTRSVTTDSCPALPYGRRCLS